MLSKSKKGLSQVITTILLIAIGIIAILIVLSIVNDLVGKEHLSNSLGCVEAKLNIESVVKTNDGDGDGKMGYNVTLARDADDWPKKIDGAKLIFSRDDGTEEIADVNNLNLDKLEKRVVTVGSKSIPAIEDTATLVQLRMVFGDKICEVSSEKNIQ